MSARMINKSAKEIFIYLSLLIVLLLTLININNYSKPNVHKIVKVLGVETQNSEALFWQNFLTKNPSYIPGWVEMGRNDKVMTVDPNYKLGVNN